MDQLVLLEVAGHFKGLVTLRAGKWPLLTMGKLVPASILTRGKGLVTKPAFVFFESSVDGLVSTFI